MNREYLQAFEFEIVFIYVCIGIYGSLYVTMNMVIMVITIRYIVLLRILSLLRLILYNILSQKRKNIYLPL